METGRSSTVELYFDPVSPNSWLASEQLARIEAAGATVVCRPVLLAALLDAHGTSGPAEVPAKRAYVFRDVLRQAALLGLQCAGPPAHPFNPLRALRAALAIEDDTRRLAFVRALHAAAWRDGCDVTDAKVLLEVLNRSGIDGEDVLTQIETEAVKQRLKDANREAVALGVFGVPTFRLHGELYWGADRVDTLLWAMQGNTVDETAYAEMLARPAGARRNR